MKHNWQEWERKHKALAWALIALTLLGCFLVIGGSIALWWTLENWAAAATITTEPEPVCWYLGESSTIGCWGARVDVPIVLYHQF